MKIISESFEVQSIGSRPTFHTVTKKVREFIANSGIISGICVVYSRHTTCAVIIDEDSMDISHNGLSFLQQDLTDFFEDVIPVCHKEGQYNHPGPQMIEFAKNYGEEKPDTLNTDAHLRSSILGRSETIPIINGNLELGEFGHIYFVDFDHTHPRKRNVIVQILGE